MIVSCGICTILAAGVHARCPGLDSFRLDGCGGSTLATCLKQQPQCGLAGHLESFASWIDTLKRDDPCSTRVAALAERYATLTDTVRHRIDLTRVSFAGEKRSPITIVLYVSAACPLCRRVYSALFYEVTKGRLRGTARLGIKVFSTRGWDRALLASRKFGKESELLCALAGVQERITTATVLQKGAEVGIPRQEFERELYNPALAAEVEASIAEAKRNGVTISPTVFIDGVRYRSFKDPQWITDAVLYKHGRPGFRETR